LNRECVPQSHEASQFHKLDQAHYAKHSQFSQVGISSGKVEGENRDKIEEKPRRYVSAKDEPGVVDDLIAVPIEVTQEKL
jgi:hypothetical protein